MTPRNEEISLGMSIVVVLMCVMFGTNTVMVKVCLVGGFGVFTAAGLRFLIAAVAVAVWAAVTGRGFRVPPGARKHVLLLSLGFTLQLALFFIGIDRTNASRATLIMNTHPVFLLVLSHFLVENDRLTPRKVVGVLLGFTGVAFVFLERRGISSQFRTGDIIMLVAVTIWGLNTVYIKHIVKTVRPYITVLYPMTFTLPFFGAAALLLDGPMTAPPTPLAVFALLYQALVASAFGFAAWNSLVKRYGVVSLHAYIFIMPITGVLLGGLILDEPIATRNMMLALTCVVTGILIVHWRGTRSVKSGWSRLTRPR
jgi:drug/metabolite transporter (DMT)-like permease